MNFLLHFLISYLLIGSVFGNASAYIIHIFIFSGVLDIGRISGVTSRFHGLYGLTLVSFPVSVLYFFDGMLAKIIAFVIVLHTACNFLTGRSMPFYPFSEKEVFVGILPENYRMHFEIAMTALLGVVFLWSFAG